MKTITLKPPKRIVIDLDGTICQELPTFDRSLAKPKPGAVETINKLHDAGWFIIIYTGRGWAEYKMTKYWLDAAGIKYDVLLCAKPIYDIWLDDRAICFEKWENLTFEE